MGPYGRHVFVCTHGDCTPADAGFQIEAKLREHLGDRRRLRNAERVKISTVQCLGVCNGGPIVAVYPDGIWYHHVDAALAETIAKEHLLEGRPVEHAIFHRLYPASHGPAYAPVVRGDAGRFLGDGPEAMSAVEETAGDNVAAQDNASEQTRQSRPEKVRQQHRKKGLVIVNTGNGKGKTTSALGIVTRAWGRGMRVGVVQFLKHEGARYGEVRAAEKMGIDWLGSGDGFTWTSKDMDETVARARYGWEIAQERIVSGAYDVLVLDEFTYTMHFGWLDAAAVIGWLAANKPPMLHLVITGRYAPQALIDFADLVTDMKEIKHPYELQGIRAQPGIEF